MTKSDGAGKACRRLFDYSAQAAACCLYTCIFSVFVSGAELSTQQLVNRSIASTETDWKALPLFSYIEQDEDIKGGEKTTRTYRVCMLAGSPYSRLTEVDSQPLSPTQSNQEAEKLRSAIARRANESPKDRCRRLAQYQKNRERMFALLNEMGQAFEFQNLGVRKLDRHEVYVLQARPRPGYQPKSQETKVLTGMEGTLWIEKNTLQWVRVEAVSIKPIWFGWFIAKILPGTRFLLEQAPVTNSIWLPAFFSYAARADILWWQKGYFHSEKYREYRLLPGSTASSANVAETPRVQESVWVRNSHDKGGVSNVPSSMGRKQDAFAAGFSDLDGA